MNSLATQLCPCGSGLRTVRCCGLNPAALPPAESTRHLVPLVERAVQAHRQGAIEAAERLCLDVLEMAPDRPGALSVLYQIRRAQGNMTASEALLRRVVHFDPNNFVATNEFALLLMSRGNLGEAEVHARNAVRIAPQNPQAHNLMGMIMTEAQRPRIGEYHYRQVLALTGQRDPILLANLAWNLKNQGRMEEARALYEESVAAAPEIQQTLLGWARLEEADRQFAAASEKLDKMDTLWPNDAGVMMSRAVLLGRQKRNDEALAVLDAVAARNPNGKLGPNELLEKAGCWTAWAGTTKHSPTSPKANDWLGNSAGIDISAIMPTTSSAGCADFSPPAGWEPCPAPESAPTYRNRFSCWVFPDPAPRWSNKP